MPINDFFYTYFVQPILQGGFFNPVNTAILSIILIIAIYYVYKLLKRIDIQIDFRFFLGILPFILWAASTRVLRDHAYNNALANAVKDGIAQSAFQSAPSIQFPRVFSESASYITQYAPNSFANFYGGIITIFPTPGSYIITFIFALIALLVGIVLHKTAKIQYWKPMFVIGIIALAFNAYIFVPLPNLAAAAWILGIALSITFVFYLLSYSHKITPRLRGFSGILTPVNLGILFAHLLDASATFISLMLFGYAEQHVLPRAVFDVFGPASFFILKLIVILPVLYAIDKYSDDRNFNNFLKIAIFILGFAPGTRDLLRLTALV